MSDWQNELSTPLLHKRIRKLEAEVERLTKFTQWILHRAQRDKDARRPGGQHVGVPRLPMSECIEILRTAEHMGIERKVLGDE